ncbi:MAG TPA: FixH family protein [Ohtaekwangia sp.]|uniref:FixH family protein n=1 Tax=Ohtaekwangia sp. TaxID=2066019 RepID=UPI002F93BF24
MNWGKWIIVSFVLFAAFIATLVTVCIRQDVSLVSKDYYQDELKYQDQITRLQNTEALSVKPAIIINQKGLEIEYALLSQITQGELMLFCPSNPQHDRTIVVPATSDRLLLIPVADLNAGMYKARFTWSMQGKDYYVEETISI